MSHSPLAETHLTALGTHSGAGKCEGHKRVSQPWVPTGGLGNVRATNASHSPRYTQQGWEMWGPHAEQSVLLHSHDMCSDPDWGEWAFLSFILKQLFSFHIYLAVVSLSCGMWDLQVQQVGSSSPTRDQTPGPPHWEYRALDTGPPGKSLL